VPGEPDHHSVKLNLYKHSYSVGQELVLAIGFAHGSGPAAEGKIASLRLYIPFENSCRVRQDHALAHLAAAPGLQYN
jgi:hypothetical protein